MKPTAKYRTAKKQSEKVTVVRFMNYFYEFTKKERSEIARKINEATFSERWTELDKSLHDLKISDTEIMAQVKAVRNGSKEAKNRS
jgi:hypothetical protein